MISLFIRLATYIKKWLKQHPLALEQDSTFKKKYLLNILKFFEGHFIKHSPYNICYATYLFKSKEAEMAF